MRFLSLFAGIGGFDLGLERSGMECAGQVEYNKFCLRVLEKHWPDVKRMEDIHNVNGTEFGAVELVCGGFPCQPFSQAGQRKGAGDDRYLWPEMLRVISKVRPRWVIGENVAGIINMELDKVLFDLEGEGYETQTFIIPAAAVDAPHRRDRVWIIAHSGREHGEGEPVRGKSDKSILSPEDTSVPERSISNGRQGSSPDTKITELLRTRDPWRWRDGFADESVNAPDTENIRLQRGKQADGGEGAQPNDKQLHGCYREWAAPWSEVAARLCRVDDGVSRRVDRLKALGNAVVPQIVEIIGRGIMDIERKICQADRQKGGVVDD